MTGTIVQKYINALYVVMYDRTADSNGYNYWLSTVTGATSQTAVTDAIAQTMAASFRAVAPTYFNTQYAALSDSNFILALYANLGGNTSGVGGDALNYWQGRLDSFGGDRAKLAGDFTKAFLEYNGTDAAGLLRKAAFENKVAVSEAWVDASRTNAFMNAATTTDAAFAAQMRILNGIDHTTASLQLALAQVNAVASTADLSRATGVAEAGQTFELTTGANRFVLTAGDDIVSGGVTTQGQLTWQTWDTIDGGAGNDTLNASMNGNTVSMQNVSSVETLNLDVTGAAATVNAADATYIAQLNVSQSADFTINSLGALPAVSLSGAGATTINFDAAALAAAAQTLNITLSGKTAGVLTVSDNGANALETIALTSSASDNIIGGLTTTGLGVTTLTVSGNQNVTVGAITDTQATLRTINAGTLTGTLNVTSVAGSTVTGGSGNDTIQSAGGNDSFAGGGGDDTFTMSTNLTVDDSIIGGDGTDIVSTAVATANGFTAARTTETITGVEILAISDAGVVGVTTANIAASINTVRLDAGTAVGASAITGGAGSFSVRVGSGTGGVLGGAITVTDTGSATTDALTLTLNGANATDAGAGQAVTSAGYETVTISTNTSALKGAQTLGAVAITPDTTGTGNLTVTGANALTVGVVTATNGAINASGMTMTTGTGFVMTAGANTATTLIGSGGDDTLLGDNVTDRNVSINGGAGNDTLTTSGAGNDTIFGGDGNDTIASATGNDSIDAGAGNDQVTFVTDALTENDTVVGGDGTDRFVYSTFTAASANDVAAQSRISGFETLRATATAAGQALTMSNYINNAGFTAIELANLGAGASGLTITNASSSLNTVRAVGATAGTHTFDRLVDTSSDTLTISNTTSGAGAASTITAFTALDEETITLTASVPTTAGANDLTITTLTVADLTTLNITSASDVIVTNLVGDANLATVNASSATGAVTVDASSAGRAVTMTGNSTSTGGATFTGGAFADQITGGAGADVLGGGVNNDTISGGAGADVISGGVDADSLTGGSGADDFNQAIDDSIAASATNFAGANVAAGDTLTFGNGVDVITDFVAGVGGDTVSVVVAGIPTTLIGETVANLTGTQEVFFVSGSYNATTGRFTVSADGVGADTAIVQADNAVAASDSLVTNASVVVLIGVDSDNLVAGNFIV